MENHDQTVMMDTAAAAVAVAQTKRYGNGHGLEVECHCYARVGNGKELALVTVAVFVGWLLGHLQCLLPVSGRQCCPTPRCTVVTK